ncbi:single-stranded DNA-binding protein [Candidatus Parcubacteria bacterium]|nr:single-stranded DNA-binding protein [Candidatus Parcubacteria bacterium]
MYLNKALVIGNLTRDPEMRSLPSGVQVTSFSVATNRVWKDKNGAKQESADYHNIVVFGRQAETVAQYLRKGSSVLVEGRMQTRSWDGADGKKNYRTEIVADRVQFGPRGSGTGAASSAPKGEDKEVKADVPPMETIDYPEESINLDDIPF